MPFADAATRPWHRWIMAPAWAFVAGAAVLGTAAAPTAPSWTPYYDAPPAYYPPAFCYAAAPVYYWYGY